MNSIYSMYISENYFPKRLYFEKSNSEYTQIYLFFYNEKI